MNLLGVAKGRIISLASLTSWGFQYGSSSASWGWRAIYSNPKEWRKV